MRLSQQLVKAIKEPDMDRVLSKIQIQRARRTSKEMMVKSFTDNCSLCGAEVHKKDMGGWFSSDHKCPKLEEVNKANRELQEYWNGSISGQLKNKKVQEVAVK